MRALAASIVVAIASLSHVSALRIGVQPTIVPARAAGTLMAGFGGGGVKATSKSKKSKTTSLSPKKQWERFKQHRKVGIPATTVYARVSGGDTWYNVGDITVSPPGAVAGAVQVQKRLILEHAVRVHPQLLPKARELEPGVESEDGTTQSLEKSQPVDAADAGFVGRADASGRYGKTESEINEREPSSLQAATSTPAGGKAKGLDSKGRLE